MNVNAPLKVKVRRVMPCRGEARRAEEAAADGMTGEEARNMKTRFTTRETDDDSLYDRRDSR